MELAELFATLDEHERHLPMNTLVGLLDRLQLSRADVAKAVQFHPDHYCRNVFHLGPCYAALILCWSPGQSSQIHDHRGSGCAVHVIEGTASETRYVRGADGMIQEAAINTYPAGHVCGSYDADIHRMYNEQAGDLITMHIYTPPLQEIHMYALDSAEVTTWSDVETLEAQRRLAEVGTL